MLWSLAEDGIQVRMQSVETPLKTGFRFSTGSRKPITPRIGLVDSK